MIFYRGFLNLLTDGRTDEQADMSETIILMISRLPAGFFFFFLPGPNQIYGIQFI